MGYRYIMISFPRTCHVYTTWTTSETSFLKRADFLRVVSFLHRLNFKFFLLCTLQCSFKRLIKFTILINLKLEGMNFEESVLGLKWCRVKIWDSGSILLLILFSRLTLFFLSLFEILSHRKSCHSLLFSNIFLEYSDSICECAVGEFSWISQSSFELRTFLIKPLIKL